MYIICMCNAVFIDFETLLENSSLSQTAVLAFNNAVKSFDNVKVVCASLENEARSFDYNEIIDKLKHLTVHSNVQFESLHAASDKELVGRIASWLSVNEVKAFVVILNRDVEQVNKAYANNVLKVELFNENAAKNVEWTLQNLKHSDVKDEVFFVADTHFYHRNIIKYCNRPWNSGVDSEGNIIVTDTDVEQMNEEIVKRWNSIVSKDSIVWHLGDFSFGGKENAEKIFPQLNGRINLVMGNHDHYKLKWYYDLGFNRVYDRKVIIDDFIILSHAPLMFLNENSPFYNIYGHVHDSPAYQTWSKTGCCVCVERHDYTPVSLKKIKVKYDEMHKDGNT